MSRIFHMLTGHVNMFFRELSIHILCPLKNLFVFILSSCKSSFYILSTSPLTNVSFPNIYCPSVGCLFTSLMILRRKILILLLSNLLIFKILLLVLLVSSNKTGHGTTDWFQIEKGVSQGCMYIVTLLI